MKKVFMFFAVLFVSLTAFGQTDSPIINEFILRYQELDSKYQENYDAKNFKQTELILKEMITLTENVKLPDAEISEYLPIIDRIKASTYYNLSCTYSLLNQKKQAIDNFEKSIAFGYNEYYHVLEDTDLDNIRKEKRFVSLLKKLSEKTYLSILQQAGDYEKSDTIGFPLFYYETLENGRMKDVKKYFKLDSIA